LSIEKITERMTMNITINVLKNSNLFSILKKRIPSSLSNKQKATSREIIEMGREIGRKAIAINPARSAILFRETLLNS